MKVNKPIFFFLALLLVLYMFSCFLISCKSQIPIKDQTVITQNFDRVKDSLIKIVINKAISENIRIPVGEIKSNNKRLDSIVNARVDEILNKLNYTKVSGDNTFELLYDALKKQIIVNSTIGKTTNQDTKIKDATKTDTAALQRVEVPVKLPLTKLQLGLIITGIIALILIVIRIIIFIRSKFI